MLTHEHLIKVICSMHPQITPDDHGKSFWVAMEVKGAEQLSPAFIVEWSVDGIPKPTQEQIDVAYLELQEKLVTESKADEVRSQRWLLLKDADVLTNRAADSGSPENTQMAAAYRQALRDVTDQPGFPWEVVWPAKPVFEPMPDSPPTAPSREALLSQVKDELRAMRKPALDAVNGIGWRASMTGDADLANEALIVSLALLEVTDDAALNAAETYEEMRLASLLAYKSLALSVSPDLANVFRETLGG